MVKNKKIILASASPRRKLLLNALLKNFGLKFDVIQANIVEYIPEKVKNYGKFAADLAELKALEVAVNNNGLIIAADTIVVFNGRILGKPSSPSEAVKMLNTLSGNQHRVYTGLVVFDTEGDKLYKTFEVTSVKFRKIQRKEINFYVKSGSPLDKAGAYGIQDDFGSTFVEKINGDYFNVVGLPVYKLYDALSDFIKLIN
ncbi:MAG TPA: Maf family protein [Ignavibacteria bacterium]|nr:Maf family protein [Ignavibacteria bacterium]